MSEQEPEIFLNGQRVTKDELNEAMDEWQDAMIKEQKAISKAHGVSDDTAAAIQYLRTRSRWSVEKEMQLVYRDKSGDPIPLSDVLAGEF